MEVQTVFLHIINGILSNTSFMQSYFQNMTDKEWIDLYKLSKQQGVTAIVFERLSDAIDNHSSFPKPSKNIILKWYSHSLAIEKQMNAIHKRSAEFAQVMRKKGLRTLVLKGIAISGYYPNPLHREFGDLDCCLFELKDKTIRWNDAYEKGNVAAEEASAEVHRGHYKHSHIKYQKLTVENHQFCLPVRGSRKTKELERHLKGILEKQMAGSKQVEDDLIAPPADFNALFLTAHAMNHFLYESIKMRHVLDWALFVEAEYQHVDWNMFWKWCDKMHYSRFVECMNWICENKLGMNSEIMQLVGRERNETFEVEKWANRMLDDIFLGDSVYNKGNSAVMVRLNLVKNFIQSAWKYRHIAQKNFVVDLVRQGSAMLWDRNPKL